MTHLALIAAAAASALDIATTCAVLRLGGRELNPVLRRLFPRIGVVPSFLVVHGAILALALAVASW